MNTSFFKKIIPLLLAILIAFGVHEGLFFVLKINLPLFLYFFIRNCFKTLTT